MHKRHELIYAQALGRHIHLWCYGHWGMPVVAFPTAAGFAHEWERQSMVEALAPLISEGRIKLYTPESTVSQTLTNKQDPAHLRMRALMAYEDFVLRDLMGFIRADCGGAELPVTLAGASLGAYYAALYALKHPHIFRYALCMSGRYQLTHFTQGFSNSDVYFNNPIAFVPNLDGGALEHVQRNTHITMVCGRGPYEEGCIEETELLCDLMAAKEIQHTRDIWGIDVAHDWKWWKRQAVFHLSQRFSQG